MTGCDCDRIGRSFDAAHAEARLRRYRSHGPDRSTRLLIEALVAQGVTGGTLLDIGGGVGAIQHELLAAGLASAVAVEASAASLDAARMEAERRGQASRVEAVHGDLLAVADRLAPADVVTLDRVICCGPEMATLVERSASLARRFYGLVYPRDAWWVRLGWRLPSDLRQRAMRSPLRLHVHRTRDVEAAARASGLRPCFRATAGVWQAAVFARD